MAEGKRWTIYVCPDCGGGCELEPRGGTDCCDCPDAPDEPNKDYPPIDKPVEVMPVSEHEAALKAEREKRKAMWDRQEDRIKEYAEANTGQKHCIRELEAALAKARTEAGEKLESALRAIRGRAAQYRQEATRFDLEARDVEPRHRPDRMTLRASMLRDFAGVLESETAALDSLTKEEG